MTQRAHKPVTVTLGGLEPMVRERVESGDYASVSEVVRAGLRALEREESLLDAALRKKVAAALADDRPHVPHEQVFARIDALHRSRKGQ